MVDQLIQKILKKEALIGIIGLGYVGLPLVLRFCEEGFRVFGFDVDSQKILKLKKGVSYIKSIPSSKISLFIHNRRLNVTNDFSKFFQT